MTVKSVAVARPTKSPAYALVLVAAEPTASVTPAPLPNCEEPVDVIAPEAMVLSNVAAPTCLLVVPTHRAFCIEIPPAVIMEPVVADVASVVSVELMPNANGTRTVVAVCPSFVIAVDRPVARSAVSALNAVDDMTVPVTTGWPALLTTNVPEPL